MARRSIVLQKKERPGGAVGSPGLERHRRASTRLSLVGLRPRDPDSVSPSETTIDVANCGFKSVEVTGAYKRRSL